MVMTYWTDRNFDPASSGMDEFRRRMDRLFEEFQGGGDLWSWPSAWSSGFAATYPKTAMFDDGENISVVAEIPGVSEKDLSLAVTDDRVTISGKKPTDVPEGYSVHRRERMPVEFNRSFSLGTRIDASKARAELKAGVLTLVLPKHPEARPRQIPVTMAKS